MPRQARPTNQSEAFAVLMTPNESEAFVGVPTNDARSFAGAAGVRTYRSPFSMKNFWRAPSRRASVSNFPDSISFLTSAMRSVRAAGRLIAFETIDAFAVRLTLSVFAAAFAAAAADILMRVILFGPSMRPAP